MVSHRKPGFPLFLLVVVLLTLLTTFTLPAAAQSPAAQTPVAEASAEAAGPMGYYRHPALHGSTLVFTAEGDLWTVTVDEAARGGQARRLTSHLGQEGKAAISPDGSRVAFSAEYEGSGEVYVMPLAGGLPRRLTWNGEDPEQVRWTRDGHILYATGHRSTLPDIQLATLDPASGEEKLLPLAQAADGVWDDAGETLFFTRQDPQNSFTKRYRGGLVENLWSWREGEEARPLTADFTGTSASPMWWRGRVYFRSDRDGTMNLWSMLPDGSGLAQHTRHVGWDVKGPSLSEGRIAYQLGADLHLYDIASGNDRKLAITLPSDFDQRRERWIDKPMDYLTAAHLSPRGERVVLTARGQVFVFPVGQGRRVEASRNDGVRYRSARFLPRPPVRKERGGEKEDDRESDDLVALSDESGEVELWRLDARGIRPAEQLTEDADTLRFDTLPSPDGRRIASFDRSDRLNVYDRHTGESRTVAQSPFFGFRGMAWSPDGRFLAYSVPAADNYFARVWIHDAGTGENRAVTSDRFDSESPAWSPDGRFLYFVSRRDLRSVTRSVWGPYQPSPFLDNAARLYVLPLREGERSPFAPATELDEESREDADEKAEKKDDSKGKQASGDEDAERNPGKAESGEDEPARPPEVRIDFEGLETRLEVVPTESGNYDGLSVTDDALYFLHRPSAGNGAVLRALPIEREEPKVVTVAGDLLEYELSADGKKLLLRRAEKLFVADAAATESMDLSEAALDLSGWTFPVDPKEEWRQMAVEAWRLLRDYFYDPNMHGVDWPAVLDKYQPLVDRVTDRVELADIFGEMTGELSALHHYVRTPNRRRGETDITPASLGAVLERDEAAGGARVVRIYRGDPDFPEELAPLQRPGSRVEEGEVITAIDGVPTLSVPDARALLRGKAGRQTLLTVRGTDGGERQVIARPIAPGEAWNLRYEDWKLERRRKVEEWSEGRIGYVHLQAMGANNYTEWARGYFPVFHRAGLIVDVRHNRGGNIDSWILGSLVRRPWMWWAARQGSPYSNMQYAFGGHMAVLIDERTASDGEVFAEGFRRLGLGKVIGTRSWGGEIWLTQSNTLVDQGIVTAAEYGVYGPEGAWLIEGHGVDPDIVVDNLPHATFEGEDAQLRTAVEHLLRRIEEDPPGGRPELPPYPDKSHPGWP